MSCTRALVGFTAVAVLGALGCSSLTRSDDILIVEEVVMLSPPKAAAAAPGARAGANPPKSPRRSGG